MSGKSILVVDDNVLQRFAVSEMLREAGCAVTTAADGQEALDRLRRRPPPDLILLDLNMPVLSGWEFRERQRQDPALASIPVVVLSASGQEAAKEDALGDVGYLQVPVAEGELLAAIARFTRRQKPSVLVVEDEARVLKLLETALRQFGFAVRTAGSGREALEIYRRDGQDIGAVLLDVQMPDVDGPGVLAALRRVNPKVRCCFMSGDAGEYSGEALRALGAAHVFRKPFPSLDELAWVLWDVADPECALA